MIGSLEASPMPLSDASGHTLATTLTWATPQLRASTDAPRLEAEILLAHVLGHSRADLYAHPERPLLTHQQNHYQTLLNRRIEGEPVPYLTGHIEFYGLDLAVDSRVLIPRPDTETLVDLTLTLIHRTLQRRSDCTYNVSLADVGTGSGCIAAALAVHAPHTHIHALDLSLDALSVARVNAERHDVVERISFLHSDLLTALAEPVDLIVSNLPYIAADEWSTLPHEVREHEPRLALYGGPDGLDVLRRLLNQAPAYLRPGGGLLIEIGVRHGPAVAHLARQTFSAADITLHRDLAGRERVLGIQTPLDGAHNG